jgi:hypothetical protein
VYAWLDHGAERVGSFWRDTDEEFVSAHNLAPVLADALVREGPANRLRPNEIPGDEFEIDTPEGPNIV